MKLFKHIFIKITSLFLMCGVACYLLEVNILSFYQATMTEENRRQYEHLAHQVSEDVVKSTFAKADQHFNLANTLIKKQATLIADRLDAQQQFLWKDCKIYNNRLNNWKGLDLEQDDCFYIGNIKDKRVRGTDEDFLQSQIVYHKEFSSNSFTEDDKKEIEQICTLNNIFKDMQLENYMKVE